MGEIVIGRPDILFCAHVYDGSMEIAVTAEVRFEDGRQGQIAICEHCQRSGPVTVSVRDNRRYLVLAE